MAGTGHTTGAGGLVSITAGPGGPTGAGGVLNITSGAGGATSGNSGDMTIDVGAVTSGTTGSIILGITNATVATIGNMGWSRIATAVDVNTTTEVIVGVTDTSIARTITLDTDDVIAGRVIIVKDESGAAGTNNITVATEGAETIDGAASVDITVNYGALRVYSDGTNWFTF